MPKSWPLLKINTLWFCVQCLVEKIPFSLLRSGMKPVLSLLYDKPSNSKMHVINYHGKNLPSQISIERVVKHFQRSGTVADLRSTYLAQRGLDFSPEKVRRVKKVYARRQKVSLRQASHSTNVTQYFVANIL